MSQAPAPALLRLREANIVRLCGLASAGEGLRLAGRHLLQDCRRRAGRLDATMEGEGGTRATWVEVREAGPDLAFAWDCWCAADGAQRGTDGQAQSPQSSPACAHVAAILTLWLRDPAIFIEDAGVAAAEPHAAVKAAPGARQRRGPAARAPAAERARTADAARSATLSATLYDALADLPAARREAIAVTALGEGGASLPAETLTGRLAETLADPEHVARLLEGLDAPSVALLWVIRLLGGSITGWELDGLAERHRGGPGAVTSARHQLQARGMLFRAGVLDGGPNPAAAAEQTPASEAIAWYVPAQMALAIEQIEHPRGDMPVRPMPIIASHGPPQFVATEGGASGTPRVWVHNAPLRQLYLAASLLAPLAPSAGTSERERSSRASAASLRTHGTLGAPLPPLVDDPPATVLAAWVGSTHLPAGMLRMAWRLDHGEHAALPAAQATKPVAALNRLPPEEWAPALRGVFRRWLECESYGELADLTLAEHRVHARCDPRHEALRRGALAAENAAARRFVVAVVSRFSTGAWYAVEDLLGLSWWAHPWFLRGRQRVFTSPAWWLAGAESERPLRARVREEWRRAEGQYISHLLTGPLHWWGVLDLAGTHEGAARAVRLTALGAYLLGRAVAAPDVARALGAGWGPAVLPVREVKGETGLAVQPCAAPPALVDALGTWARVVGPAGDRMLWRFSNDLAARAFDAGIAPEPLLTQLRAADARDHTQVAPGIAQLMTDGRARYGASRIEMGNALLEAVDAPTMREALAHVPEIAARCRQISPTGVLVPAELAEALAHMLDRRGFVV